MGMHRSGTSALTGALQLMGCQLGEKLMGPWKGDNPKGFFENMKVFRTNEHFIKKCNSSWDDPCFYGPDWILNKEVKQYKRDLKDLLEQEIGHHVLSAVKDPRICILFPAWQDVFSDMGIGIKCVFAVRDPVEVAKSLQKRDGFSLEHGLLMWMNHMLTAEYLTRDLPRVFVAFESLIENPEGEISRIIEKLELSFPRPWQEARDDVMAFLDRDLRHHKKSPQLSNDTILTLVHECYASFLESASKKDDSERIIDRNNTIRKKYEEYTQFFYNSEVKGMVSGFNKTRMEIEKQTERCQFVEGEMDRLNKDIQRRDQIIVDCEAKILALQNTLLQIKGSRSWRAAMLIKKCNPASWKK
jgi:hypothetical protein